MDDQKLEKRITERGRLQHHTHARGLRGPSLEGAELGVEGRAQQVEAEGK